MNRLDFDRCFIPMTKALSLKISKLQADYFFDHYKAHHSQDFKGACEYLSRGNSGYLPKQNIFDDAVVAAKEMRLAGEKVTKEVETTTYMHYGPPNQRSPMDDLFAQCQSKNIRFLILGDNQKEEADAMVYIQAALDNPDFVNHQFGWISKEGLHPAAWLREQLANHAAKKPTTLQVVM